MQLFGAPRTGDFREFREELFASLTPRPGSEPEADGRAKARSDSPADGLTKTCRVRRTERGSCGRSRQTFAKRAARLSKGTCMISKVSASLFRPHDSEGLHDLRIAPKKCATPSNSLGLRGGRSSHRQRGPPPPKLARTLTTATHGSKARQATRGQSEREAAGEALDHRAAPGVERRAALWLLRRFESARRSQHEEALAALATPGRITVARAHPRKPSTAGSKMETGRRVRAGPHAGHGPAPENPNRRG